MTNLTDSRSQLGPSLSFDVVIATRNRPEALALSIPLILGQSRQPERLIVIDSSDDHGVVSQTVAQAVQGWPGKVIVEHSGPGLPYQRNRGLKHVQADVVIFPDDDSLFYPDTAAAIMNVYERDRGGIVAGVCGVPQGQPPKGVLPDIGYTTSAALQREDRRGRFRNRVQKRFSHLKPSLYLGQTLAQRHVVPRWITADPTLSIVEHMTGFRMSFRTSVIKQVGFDDLLPGYGLSEDIDASLAAARSGLLVGARDAKIYHHRFPGGRGNGFALGAFGILNRVYITLKHLNEGPFSEAEQAAARSRLRWFVRFARLNALAGLRSDFGRDKMRGISRAYTGSAPLWRANRNDLADCYRSALKELGL